MMMASVFVVATGIVIGSADVTEGRSSLDFERTQKKNHKIEGIELDTSDISGMYSGATKLGQWCTQRHGEQRKTGKTQKSQETCF